MEQDSIKRQRAMLSHSTEWAARRRNPLARGNSSEIEGKGKPANGFEPMAFALQKRCSTAELSRHPLSLSLAQGPKQQLAAVVAAGFCQQVRHVAFHRAVAQGKGGGNAFVASPFFQQVQDAPLGRSEHG